MEGKDQGLPNEEDHLKEGDVNMHSSIFPSKTSPNNYDLLQQTTAPHAARHVHDPMSSVSHDQMPLHAPPIGPSAGRIPPSSSLAGHLTGSASTSGVAENSTSSSRSDASSVVAVTGLRLIETSTAAASEVHPARLPSFDVTLANIMPTAPNLPTVFVPGPMTSFYGFGTHRSQECCGGSQDQVSSYDANVTMPDSPLGGVAAYHPSDEASQALTWSICPSKSEWFTASGGDVMSMNSMSMELSCLQSDDHVGLPDAMINIDNFNDDVDNSEHTVFIENLLLRGDDAQEAFMSTATDPSSASKIKGLDNKQSSKGETDDQAAMNHPITNLEHWTDEKDQNVDDGYDDDLIASILKRRTADPLPDGSHGHHQWQGEAGDEDDDIVTDIIDQQMNIMSKGEASATTKQLYDISETRESLVSSTKTEKKKPRRRLDESRTIEPADDDILLGRGGHTNIHPGNVRFREKALELSPWYETCSKEQKTHVSNMLIEIMKREGRRFLEKGDDGLWHEVVGHDGVRRKASQLFREPYTRRTL